MLQPSSPEQRFVAFSFPRVSAGTYRLHPGKVSQAGDIRCIRLTAITDLISESTERHFKAGHAPMRYRICLPEAARDYPYTPSSLLSRAISSEWQGLRDHKTRKRSLDVPIGEASLNGTPAHATT